MAQSDLEQFTIDAEEAGRNVARTMRLLAKVQLEWSHAHSSSSRKGPQPLGVIEFDKMVTLFCRLWNQLHDSQMTRYRTAFLQRRGFHGPGMAMKIDRRADEKASLGKDPLDRRRSDFAFATEIVEKLKPALSDTRILFRLDGMAWNPKAKVYPALERSEWDAWISQAESVKPEYRFLTTSEVVYAETISMAMAGLSPKQIRALGTHCCAKDTQKDIQYNTTAWERSFNHFLEGQQDPHDDDNTEQAAYRMVTTSREIRQKSYVNQGEYETAYRKCSQSLASVSSGKAILEAFKAAQQPANLIWQDAFIAEVAKIAQTLLDFSVYCRRGFLARISSSNLKPSEIRESDTAHERLVFVAKKIGGILPMYATIPDMSQTNWTKALSVASNRVLGLLPSSKLRHSVGIC